jgi:four helix bundle protein
MIKSYKDLEVYNLSYSIAMEIFVLTRKFPKEELYSLTSQIVRSSRSISANIAEGWAKREHPKKFKLQLIDALGSASETENWIAFALDCQYLSAEQAGELLNKLNKIGRMLTKLHQNWKSKSEATAPASNL